VRFQVVPASYLYLLRDAPDPQVLLQLREGTGFRDGFWAAAAAGHIEEGESAHAAAVREAAEELGVVVDPADLHPLVTLHRTERNGRPVDERVDFFFTCRRWTGEPRLMEPDKAADLRWCGLDALPDPVVPHELLVLDGLRAGNLPAIVADGFMNPVSHM